MFSIVTATDFLRKVEQDWKMLEADFANPGLAINCILSSYHLHEWLWARQLKDKNPRKLNEQVLRDKDAFVAWLEANCPHFNLLQELANGSKHCAPVHPTDHVEGYGQGPFGVGPFDKAYLLIDLGDDLPGESRYLVATDVLQAIVKFWQNLFVENRFLAA